MSTLPHGWHEVALERVLQSHNAGVWGKEPEGAEHTLRIVRNGDIGADGSVRFDLPLRGVSAAELVKASLEPGDILVTTSGDVGKCSIWPTTRPGCGASNFARRLRCGSLADPRFVLYWLRTDGVQAVLRTAARGVTIKNLPTEVWGRLSVPLAPLPLQRLIVSAIDERLSSLESAVAGLRRAHTNLVRWEASELVSAILGGERRSDDAGDEARWPLPSSWSWTRVQDVGHVLLGRQRAPQYLTGRYSRPYLRVANIGDDFLRLEDVKEMDFDTAHFAKYSLVPGDILVSEGQSPELVGQSAIYRGEVPNACFQKTLHRFRAYPGVVLPEFAQIVFRAYVKSGVFQRYASLTVNIAHLTLERFRDVPFPLPPLDEQKVIVDQLQERLSQVRKVADDVDLQLARASRLRQAILQHAFSGQLVTQVPLGVPASPDPIPGDGSELSRARRSKRREGTREPL